MMDYNVEGCKIWNEGKYKLKYSLKLFCPEILSKLQNIYYMTTPKLN